MGASSSSQPLFANHPTQKAEQSFGKLVEKGVEFGEPIWLNDGTHDFLALFTPDKSGKPKGGAIILHDAGAHPDHNNVVSPIRKTLPAHGWATLAIQLPMINDITQYEKHQTIVNQRINKAVEYFSTKGIGNLALIGHGTGAISGATYLVETNHNIRAYIAISLGVIPQTDSSQTVPTLLENISLPMLDIFGGQDLPSVLRSADIRALAAKSSSGNASKRGNYEPYKRSAIAMEAGNKTQGYIAYRQIKIAGASHDFKTKSQFLAKRVLGWLDRHAKGIAIRSSRPDQRK